MEKPRSPSRYGRGSRLAAVLLLLLGAPASAVEAPATAPSGGTKLADVNGDGVVRIGCLGDGNTAWQSTSRGWCELVIPALEKTNVERLNLAQTGATAAAGTPSGVEQVDRAVAGNVDAVILAFGTEDLGSGKKSPEEVVAAYQELAKKAEAAKILVFIGSIPSHPEAPNDAATGRAGALLAKSFPEVIDFASGFEKRDFDEDGTKLNWMGQVKRANRAYLFLVARVD